MTVIYYCIHSKSNNGCMQGQDNTYIMFILVQGLYKFDSQIWLVKTHILWIPAKVWAVIIEELFRSYLLSGFQHVVSMPTRDGDEGNGLGVVPNFLDVRWNFLDDFLESVLLVLGGVHLVDGNDELLDPQGVAEKGVFTGLTVLGDTGLELASTGGDNQNSAVSLKGTKALILSSWQKFSVLPARGFDWNGWLNYTEHPFSLSLLQSVTEIQSINMNHIWAQIR